jgi:hypothetical protein
LNPGAPEDKVVFALNLFKASAVPEGRKENTNGGKQNMKKNRMKFGALLMAMLILSMAFAPIVSAQKEKIKISENNQTNFVATVGSIQVNLTSDDKHTSAILTLTQDNIAQVVKIKVDKKDDIYTTKIYDNKGKLLHTKLYNSDPLSSKNGELPAVVSYLLVNAFIDIYPDNNQYTYTRGSSGAVNIHVKNTAYIDAVTNYYLKIPSGVTYLSVSDGPQPNNVYYLLSGQCVLLPEIGSVCGPATVLYWQSFHFFDYEKFIKVNVRYGNTGSFTQYAYDHTQEVLSGWPSWDDDFLSVTVN